MEIKNRYMPEGYLISSEANRIYTSNLKNLESAMKRGVILEGIATVCDCTDMSLRVRVGNFEGVIDHGETMYCHGEIKDIAVISRVGKPVCFKIKSIEADGGVPRLHLSRRDAQIECYEAFTSKLCPGDIIPSVVTHLDPFGAFVDIGCGIISLITIDCISVSRIFHPSDRLFMGERLYTVVKSRDTETGRLYMSLRELLGTWEENAAEFTPYSTVSGIVRSVEDYGVFVELSPNLAGLAELRDDVAPGDVCSVYIKSIIRERMKIKLVIIDTCGEAKREPLKYFVDVGRVHHIDSWYYSPIGAKKQVETVFG